MHKTHTLRSQTHILEATNKPGQTTERRSPNFFTNYIYELERMSENSYDIYHAGSAGESGDGIVPTPTSVQNQNPRKKSFYSAIEKHEIGEYHIFLSNRSSFAALSLLVLWYSIGFLSLAMESLAWDPTSTVSIVRYFRVLSLIPLYVYSFYEFRRWREVRTAGGEAAAVRNTPSGIPSRAAWWANQSILWISVTGGAVLIIRCMEGECEKNQPEDLCNTTAVQRELPVHTYMTVLLSALINPIILKSHDELFSIISYVLTFLSIIMALVVMDADVNSFFSYIATLIMVVFCLGDYFQSNHISFRSDKNASESHAEALRTTQLSQSAKEENEQLCILMGNVAHDLKTPLQSFMAEIDVLKDVLDMHFADLQQPSADIKQRKRELDEIVATLGNIYVFMMIAINRGEDFRKATAGISLIPRAETFHIEDTLQWTVSIMSGGPTAVVLRIIKYKACAASDTCTPLCPMIISDKHWFSENILSYTSNALKYTVNGSVELEYRLAELTVTDKELPVVLVGLSVKEWFATTEGEHQQQKGKDSIASSSSSQLSASRSSLYLLVLVHDTGIGLAPAVRGTLFQSFRQAQHGTGGTGLGLFSVAKRMEALGGHCGVQDREDGRQGASFWMAYPYRPDWSVDVDAIERFTPFNSRSRSASVCLKLKADDYEEKVDGISSSNRLITVDDEKDTSRAQLRTSVDSNSSGQNLSSSDTEGVQKQTPPPPPQRQQQRPQQELQLQEQKPQLYVVLQTLLRERKPDTPIAAAGAAVAVDCAVSSLPKKAVASLSPPLDDPFWRSVLLVEDSPMIIKSLSRMFVREGFDIDIAQNGAIGLEKMMQKEYVLVLTDIQMPVMDGHEMTKRFRAHEEEEHFSRAAYESIACDVEERSGGPAGTAGSTTSTVLRRRLKRQLLVGMSANCTSAIVGTSKDSGMDAFLPKPVLKGAVETCLVEAYGNTGMHV